MPPTRTHAGSEIVEMMPPMAAANSRLVGPGDVLLSPRPGPLLSSCTISSRPVGPVRIALLDDTTALVVFDNHNQVASIDLSLKGRDGNGLFPAPSLGSA